MRDFRYFVFCLLPVVLTETPGRIHVRFIPLGGPGGGLIPPGHLGMDSLSQAPLEHFLRVLPLDQALVQAE